MSDLILVIIFLDPAIRGHRHPRLSLSENTRRTPTTSNNIQQHPAKYNLIQQHPATCDHIQQHPTTSNNSQQHSTTTNSIQQQPTTFNNNQHHPTTANIIQQQPTTANKNRITNVQLFPHRLACEKYNLHAIPCNLFRNVFFCGGYEYVYTVALQTVNSYRA
jgi:hypothetical protein